jgi:hypothetical protein
MATTAVHTDIQPDKPVLGTFRRTGLVATIVLGPLSIAILRGILPYGGSDDAATITAKVAGHQTAEAAVLWLTLVATLTLVPGVIAVGLLAARSARRLGSCAMVLAVAGFSLLWSVSAVDFTTAAALHAGIDHGTTTKILDQLNANPVLVAGTIGFVLGHVLGMILLGVALLRGRAVPAWAAWALIVSQPLHAVFAVIVPSNVLDAAAWGLTTVGFAAAAYAVNARYRHAGLTVH